jgi:hypothetical protein
MYNSCSNLINQINTLRTSYVNMMLLYKRAYFISLLFIPIDNKKVSR